jgi:hypothetical protein
MSLSFIAAYHLLSGKFDFTSWSRSTFLLLSMIKEPLITALQLRRCSSSTGRVSSKCARIIDGRFWQRRFARNWIISVPLFSLIPGLMHACNGCPREACFEQLFDAVGRHACMSDRFMATRFPGFCSRDHPSILLIFSRLMIVNVS